MHPIIRRGSDPVKETLRSQAMRKLSALVLAVLLAASPATRAEGPMFPPLAPEDTPRAQLVRVLNRIGHGALAARRAAVARITTRAELEDRQRLVRETVARLIGGLIRDETPLNARVTGRHQRDRFTVENVVFDSVPGFPITANLYLPKARNGRLPAVVASLGHWEAGKAAERLGPDLARKGFVVLQYDPFGQGERSQHWDAELRASRAGGSVEEHSQAGLRAELIGDSVARYFIRDAMRAVDYLQSRGEVDRERIGAAGCSGGGTVTTYLAALDPRIKAAAISCYITSWSALLDGPGAQDSEQTLAGFLKAGLDMADYVALIAPRPLLIVSTTEDFFPLEGARATYEEGRRHYALFDAADRIAWSVGAGEHGTQRGGREAINAFFLHWLAGSPGDAADESDARLDPEDLACTETGQLATSLRPKTVGDLIAARASDLAPVRAQPAADPEAWRSAVLRSVSETIGAPERGREAPALTVHRSAAHEGYRLDVVSFEVREGQSLWGLLAVPAAAAPKRGGVLLADPRLRSATSSVERDVAALARAGHVVLAVELSGAPTSAELPARQSLLGPLITVQRRATAVGASLAALRAVDALRGLDALASRPEVASSGIDAFGYGVYGVPVLHAAALDPRVKRLVLQQAPVSYRQFLDHSIHRNLAEMLIPGVLRRYDLGDLLLALAPRPVSLLEPVDAVGQPLRRAELARYLGPLQQRSAHIRVGRRVEGEALRFP
jgi:cephalosporin-C deacetylase-like acetyl esterase